MLPNDLSHFFQLSKPSFPDDDATHIYIVSSILLNFDYLDVVQQRNNANGPEIGFIRNILFQALYMFWDRYREYMYRISAKTLLQYLSFKFESTTNLNQLHKFVINIFQSKVVSKVNQLSNKSFIIVFKPFSHNDYGFAKLFGRLQRIMTLVVFFSLFHFEFSYSS